MKLGKYEFAEDKVKKIVNKSNLVNSWAIFRKDEQDLVNALRKGNAFILELSLVAEINGKIVEHIMFTEAMIDHNVVLALVPLSVLSYSVVLGSEEYYPKLGYLPADSFVIVVGSGSIVSQFFGANDEKGTATAIRNGIIITIACTLCISILALVMTKPILILLNIPVFMGGLILYLIHPL